LQGSTHVGHHDIIGKTPPVTWGGKRGGVPVRIRRERVRAICADSWVYTGHPTVFVVLTATT